MQVLSSAFSIPVHAKVLPLSDNYGNAFREPSGAEHLLNLSVLPVQPAGQLLHIQCRQVIDEGTLIRKKCIYS